MYYDMQCRSHCEQETTRYVLLKEGLLAIFVKLDFIRQSKMAYHLKVKLEDISNFFDIFYSFDLKKSFLEFGNDTTLNYTSIALSYLVSKKLNFLKKKLTT